MIRIWRLVIFTILILFAQIANAQTAPVSCPPDCPQGAAPKAEQQRGTTVGVTIDLNTAVDLIGRAAKARKEKREREAKARADAEAASASAANTTSIVEPEKPKQSTPAPITKPAAGPVPVKVDFGSNGVAVVKAKPTAVKVNLDNGANSTPKQKLSQNTPTKKLQPIKEPPVTTNALISKSVQKPETKPQLAPINTTAATPADPIILANPNSKIVTVNANDINVSGQKVKTDSSDNRNLALWLAIATAVGAGVFGAAKIKSKKEKNDDENRNSISAIGENGAIKIGEPIFKDKNAKQYGILTGAMQFSSKIDFKEV